MNKKANIELRISFKKRNYFPNIFLTLLWLKLSNNIKENFDTFFVYRQFISWQ